MNAMKGYLANAALAAGLIFAAFPTTSMAQADSAAIVAPPTLTAWSKKVFSDLNQRLRVRDAMGPTQTQTGIAAVKFNCSETGAPAGVSLYKSSGNRELDQATVRAVRQIVSLHPLPRGLGHDQQYIVRVLFANTDESARRQIAAMQREATERNAWYAKNETSTAALELAPVG
jgi:TonB family protein